MLVELHSLTSHSPSNLNRDDLGRPKAATFGGTQRARISSQALKRSIRTSNDLEEKLGDHLSTRSRQIPEKLIFDVLKQEIENDADLEKRLKTLCEMFTEVLGKPHKNNSLHTAQITFLTENEIERSRTFIRDLLNSDTKLTVPSLKEIKKTAAMDIGLDETPEDGVDMALFGRMTTDEEGTFVAVDASMQVAHAISTHTVVPEVDWFTAVDDIVTDESETGSAHLGEVEFNSAVFYKYFSCNFPLLIRNLGDDQDVAIESLAAVLSTACRVTPSGKQNSFASHSLADTVLLVMRPERIPVSLANAFEKPVQAEEDGYLATSRTHLAQHYREIKKSYSLNDLAVLFTVSEGERKRLAAELPADVKIVSTLSELIDIMRDHLKGWSAAS